MSPLIAKISFANSNNFHVKPAKSFSHWLGNFQLWVTMRWIHIFGNNFLLACSHDLLFTLFTDHALALLPAKFRVLILSGTDSKLKTPGWPKTPPALNKNAHACHAQLKIAWKHVSGMFAWWMRLFKARDSVSPPISLVIQVFPSLPKHLNPKLRCHLV